MKPADCQPKLQQKYQRETWQALLPQLLPGVELFAQPVNFPLTSEHERGIATARRQFGAATLADGKRIAFYEIEVAPDIQLQSNRVGLRSLIVKCIDEVSAHAVLAFFVQPGKSFYRLTYAAKESRLGEDLKIRTEQTAPRRFTYILGEGESCRTAAERFGKLPSNTKIADLTEAFSVDKLNKEFFADFRKAFDVVAKDILARNKGWEHADAERETQTLLNRLLFLYFIQRKGWLDRQPKYLITNFDRVFQDDPEGTSFNDKFLKPFFVKLSAEDVYFPNLELGDLPFLNGGLFDDEIGSLTERGRMKVGNAAFRHVFDHLLEAYNFTVREDTPLDQEVAIDPEMIGKIFESLVLQLEQSDTGGKTSRHDTGSYYTPRPIVHYLCREGLRAWLEQSPPAASPSPLAESAERGERAGVRGENRKSEIANRKSDDWPSRLEKLFALDASDGIDDDERAQLNELLTPDEARTLLDRLDDFRACDPAVGSGAFLVGLLHELVNLRRLCESRSRGKDPALDVEWLYETKKRVIENVLYGVDIQQRAVEICKLRLWISLMVDYPLEVDPANCALPDFRRALKKITPLPNLDFKIRRANSLIEQIRGQAVKFPQTAADSRDFALSLNRLATAKNRFYEARKKKDKRLAQLDALDATAELAQYEFNAAKLKYGLLPSDDDAERVTELAHAEVEMGKLKMQIAVARKKSERDKDDDIERLSRVFNDEAKPTFVWQLDFAEIFHRGSARVPRAESGVAPDSRFTDLLPSEKLEGRGFRRDAENGTRDACAPHAIPGFDLVLANPPFVRQEKIKELKPALQNAYECYTGTADLYVYFIERGVKLLRPGGALAYISSNSYLNSGFGEKLRRFLVANTRIRQLIDFAETKVFEAVTEPCVICLTNDEAKSNQTDFLKWDQSTPPESIAKTFRSNSQKISQGELKPEGWQLESPVVLRLLEKLRKSGKPLGEYVNGRFYRGILTGLNEAFIIDRTTRDRLIQAQKKSADILMPLLRGRDLKRWTVEFAEQYLIKIESSENKQHAWSGKSEREAEKIFSETYPAIYDHFTSLRSIKLDKPDARGCVNKWEQLQRRDDQGKYFWELRSCIYWDVFEEPRIVYQVINRTDSYSYDSEPHLSNDKTYVVPTTDLTLLALLNSKALTWFIHKDSGVPIGGFLNTHKQMMERIPIPPATQVQKDQLAVLVSYAIHLAKTFPPSAADSNDARDELMKSYFQQLMDAMVYELFFPEELHPAGKYFFKPLAEENLPALDAIKGDKTAKLRTIFEQLFDKDHVIRKNCFFLDTLETVRIIEGKARKRPAK